MKAAPGITEQKTISARAHPNLALIKYWGKSSAAENLPATPSIGISLESLETTTLVRRTGPARNSNIDAGVGSMEGIGGSINIDVDDGGDGVDPRPARSGLVLGGNKLSWTISIDGIPQETARFRAFFEAVLDEARARSLSVDSHLEIQSSNNFPSAAGLASSASGFAALAGAANEALGLGLSRDQTSALARRGSGSASRSVYGGFVSLSRGANYAVQRHPPQHWPELRCIIIIINRQKKPVSSRAAMERCRLTSPYYKAWLDISGQLYDRSLEAVDRRDMGQLGPLMRQSYLAMFSTMFSMDKPIIFWEAMSLEIIKAAEDMRARGIPVFETMDAGPQIKLISTEEYCGQILSTLEEMRLLPEYVLSPPGGGLEVFNE